jgi:hypothetical protein|tara:strand:- start:67 stop:477 length:411 start_codon:yes stop_codon:yes gene_type:complete
MSGLESGFDKLAIIKEELTTEGLYYKNEDGTQGFVPRAENNNYWGFTEDQELQRNRWVREALLDFPKAEEGMVEFLMSFYMKFPDKYEEIMKTHKDKPSRNDTISDLRKKYSEVDNHNNKVYDITDDEINELFLTN